MSSDRVVLVTGGNRGIGRAIAERFVAAGYRVAVTARSGEGPEGTLTVRADVTDAASLDVAFTEVEQQLGAPTIVVANAGITKDTLLLRMIPTGIAIDLVADILDIAGAECNRFYTTFQLAQAGDVRLHDDLSAAVFETIGEA